MTDEAAAVRVAAAPRDFNATHINKTTKEWAQVMALGHDVTDNAKPGNEVVFYRDSFGDWFCRHVANFTAQFSSLGTSPFATLVTYPNRSATKDAAEQALRETVAAVEGGMLTGTTNYVSRTLRIGYNAAASVIDELVRDGVLSEPDAGGARRFLKGQSPFKRGGKKP